jgi:hypothetical protein
MQYATASFLRTHKWQAIRRVLFALITLEIVIVLALLTPALERQLNAWGLLPQHQQMTELYITNAHDVVHTYTPQEQQFFAFSVHNLQDTPQMYGYRVTATTEDNGVIMVLDQGEVTLGHDGVYSKAAKYKLYDMGKRTHIQVELSNGQKVGYWMDRK